MKVVFVLAAAALAAPFVGRATVLESSPKPTPRQHILDIDFWGTISEVQDTPGRRVGEAFQGSFRINLGSTPENLSAGNRYDGTYWWNHLQDEGCFPNCAPDMDAPHDFVTTRGAPRERGAFSQDRVIVSERGDGAGGGRDQIEISDMEHGPPGGTNPVWEGGLIVGSDTLNFIRGTGVRQKFDVQPASAPGHTTAVAFFTEVIDGVWTRFWVEIDRVRATPRVCRP
jgi:hypothetical protein